MMFHSKSTSFAGVGLGTSFRENLGVSDQKDSKSLFFSNFSKACCFEFFHPRKTWSNFSKANLFVSIQSIQQKNSKNPKEVISFRRNFGIHWNWIFCKKSQKSKKKQKDPKKNPKIPTTKKSKKIKKKKKSKSQIRWRYEAPRPPNLKHSS